MKQHPYLNETGGMMALIAVVVSAILALTALVIDHSRLEVTLNHIQRAADASALAGAKELDGTPEGWQEAKLAALAVFQTNALHNVDSTQQTALVMNSPEGVISPWDADTSVNRSSVATSEDIRLEIERGFYTTEGEFISFEGEQDMFGSAAYSTANGIRVRAQVDNWRTTFANIFRVVELDNMQREATAASNVPVAEDVLPFAIRACDLLLDSETRRSESEEGSTHDEYIPSEQCRRPLVFTVADPLGLHKEFLTGEDVVRRDGFARYLSYNLLPDADIPDNSGENFCYDSDEITGDSDRLPNCKARTIVGVLGVSSEIDSTPASGADVSTWLRAIVDNSTTSQTQARIGDHFRPLEDIGDLTNRWTTDGLEGAVASWINSGDQLNKVFRLPDGDGGFYYTPNYPRQRSLRKSQFPMRHLYLHFPVQVDDQVYRMRLIMGNNRRPPPDEAYLWTNPMCHSQFVYVNWWSESSVRKAKAMVIAPKDNRINYCDYESMFNSEQQQSLPPTAETEPIVVGMVDIYVIDANLRNLRAQFPPSQGQKTVPVYPVNAYNRSPLPDWNPTSLDLTVRDSSEAIIDSINLVQQDTLDSLDCLGSDCDQIFDRVPEPYEVFSQIEHCFNTNITTDAGVNVAQVFNSIAGDPGNARATCRQVSLTGDLSISRSCFDSIDSNMRQRIADNFTRLFTDIDATLPANPGTACLPVAHDDCPNQNDPRCWDGIKPRNAGAGCSGFRARLSCEGEDASFSGEALARNRRPMLVSTRRSDN